MIQLKKLFFLFISLFCCISIFGQNIPLKPSPAKFVNDNALLLSFAQRDTLESKLKTFSDKTSNQIVILTINSLEGYTVEEYSLKVAQTWGIGQKGQDNGILILVAKNDRKMRVEVGYGLETSITDAYAQKLINTILKPNFKQAKFYTGLHLASNELIKKINPSYEDISLEGIAEVSQSSSSSITDLTDADVFPPPNKWIGIIDSAGFFTQQEIAQFDKELKTFEKETSMKILILTLPQDLTKNANIYTYFFTLQRRWFRARRFDPSEKTFFMAWQPSKNIVVNKLFYHEFDKISKDSLSKVLGKLYVLANEKQRKEAFAKVLQGIQTVLRSHYTKTSSKVVGWRIINTSLFVYLGLIVILIVILRLKYRDKITAKSVAMKIKQKAQSVKKQQFLRKPKFGLLIILPLILFQIIIALILNLEIGLATFVGIFILDFILIYITWSLATAGLWKLPSGGGSGSYSGGSYSSSSGSSYSSSYSDSYSSSYSDSYSDYGGGSFGGGGASGDW